MKKLLVKRGGDVVSITAPDDKEMVINESHLANGILTIGEYGPSGLKIAAFHKWDEVIFDAEDHGYIINNEDPF
jgi:hypothetical protein